MTSRLTVIITLIILGGFILCGCCCCAFTKDQTLINSGLEFLSAGKVRIVGSGEITTKEYDYFGFDAIAVSDAFKATIKQGDDFSVVVRTDEGVMPHVEVVKSGNTLKIGILEERYSLSNIKIMQVEITMPELSALRLSGASNATISGFSSSSDLELDVSGASTLRGQDFKTGYL